MATNILFDVTIRNAKPTDKGWRMAIIDNDQKLNCCRLI